MLVRRILAHISLKTIMAYGIITDFLIFAFHDIGVKEVCLKKDSATSHTYHATIDLLHHTFDGRLISRNTIYRYTIKRAVSRHGQSTYACSICRSYEYEKVCGSQSSAAT